MRFTKSKLEMVYQYATTTKGETIDGTKETLPVIKDELTRAIMRNAIEKRGKPTEPECSQFVAESKACFIEKRHRFILHRLAEAKEHTKQLFLQEHDLLGIERSQPETRHVAALGVLSSGSPVDLMGEQCRFFLPEAGCSNARASEKRGEIKIRIHAIAVAGKPCPGKKEEHGR